MGQLRRIAPAPACGAPHGSDGELVGMFDRVAGSYDRVGPPMFRPFAAVLADGAELGGPRRVLDLGTGTGAVLREAAARAERASLLVGVDLSVGMLRQARASSRGCELLRMDGARLGFADAVFDRALCGFGLNLFPDPARALDEWRRVLEPGGRLALTTWADDCPYFHRLASLFRKCLPKSTLRAGAARGGSGTESGLERLLGGASFAAVEVRTAARTVVYRTAEEWWESLWTYSPRQFLDKLDAATLRRLESRLLEEARAQTSRDGIVAELRACVATAHAA